MDKINYTTTIWSMATELLQVTYTNTFYTSPYVAWPYITSFYKEHFINADYCSYLDHSKGFSGRERE